MMIEIWYGGTSGTSSMNMDGRETDLDVCECVCGGSFCFDGLFVPRSESINIKKPNRIV